MKELLLALSMSDVFAGPTLRWQNCRDIRHPPFAIPLHKAPWRDGGEHGHSIRRGQVMWTCPQDRMRDEFRVGIHDTSNEFRLKLEGCLGAAESREVESCWQTAASTIGGRHFTVDVSQVKSLDSTAAELLSRLRKSGAEFVSGAQGNPPMLDWIEKLPAGRPTYKANSVRLPLLPMLLGCLITRLKAWAG